MQLSDNDAFEPKLKTKNAFWGELSPEFNPDKLPLLHPNFQATIMIA
jgi:hypothetical protein